MNYSVVVLIPLILLCFCRKNVTVLHIAFAFTDNFSSKRDCTEPPKKKMK